MIKIQTYTKQLTWLKELFFLVLLSIGFFFLMSFDINSWYYSAIGDEYAFFDFAKKISLNKVDFSILPKEGKMSILSQKGVYESTPVLSSIYQAAVMKVFGINHTGWIMSSILIVIFSFPFYYYFVKDLYGKKTAILSLVVFASSHYLWAFTHLGYWNIQVFFPVVASFFLFFLGIKKNNSILMFLGGLFAGLCFYGSYLSRVAIILLSIEAIHRFKYFYHRKLLAIAFYFGFFLLFIPFVGVNRNEILHHTIKNSVLNSHEIPENQRVQFFFSNLKNSFLGLYHNPHTIGHFISGSLLDPITGVLYTLGLFLLIFSWRKNFFVLLSFLIILIITGGLSSHATLPTTRLFFILITTSLTTGYCISIFYDFLKRLFLSVITYSTILILLFLIFLANSHRFYLATPKKTQLTREAVTMRAIQENCNKSSSRLVIYQTPDLINFITEVYEIPVKVIDTSLLLSEQLQLKDYDCIVLMDTTDSNARTYLQGKLENYFLEETSDFIGLTKVLVYTISEKTI